MKSRRRERKSAPKKRLSMKVSASKYPSGFAVEAKRRWGLIRIQNLEEECAFSL